MLKQHAKKRPIPFHLFVVLLIFGIAGLAITFFGRFAIDTSAPRLTRVPYAVDEKITLLFWSKLWSVPAKRSEGFLDQGFERGDQCPIACEVTTDQARVDQAHAFIVHARDPFPLPPHRNVPWVLTTLENPVYTPVLKYPSYVSQFHLLRSYRLDADFPTPLFTKPNLEPPLPFRNKTGGIMAVFTNCEPVRTEYLRQLMQYIDVDSYGGCLRNKKGLVDRYVADFKYAKTRLQRNYKFVLTFFNQDCDYFVDDQILHALNAGSVPVVMGTDKIREFLPGNLANSFVDVRDFKNPRELAARLAFLMSNETEYGKYLEWKVKGLGDIGGTVIGRYWARKFHHWCQVCQAIARGQWHKEGLKADLCQARKRGTWGI